MLDGALFVVCLPAPWLMAFIFNARSDCGWRPFFVTALLQLAFALTVPCLIFVDWSLGDAISAPIVAAAIVGFSAAMIAAFGQLAQKTWAGAGGRTPRRPLSQPGSC